VERIPQGGKKKRVWSAFNNSRPVEKTRAQTDLTMQAQYLQDLATITALIKVGFIATFSSWPGFLGGSTCLGLNLRAIHFLIELAQSLVPC
jgi:hypothetical protein